MTRVLFGLAVLFAVISSLVSVGLGIGFIVGSGPGGKDTALAVLYTAVFSWYWVAAVVLAAVAQHRGRSNAVLTVVGICVGSAVVSALIALARG
jgi:hypothetical protein